MRLQPFIKKSLIRPLLSLVIAFVLLELGLQIGAVIVWAVYHNSHREPVAGNGSKVILCVGDSFTYGLGSSSADGSYPSQLQKLLGTKKWKVINCGWPAQSSADIAASLDLLLIQHKPSFVFIMAGINDSWSKTSLAKSNRFASELQLPGSFQWKWRTRRLFGLIRDHIDEIFFKQNTFSVPKPMPSGQKQIYSDSRKLSLPSSDVRTGTVGAKLPSNAGFQTIMDQGWDAFRSNDFQTAETHFRHAAEVRWNGEARAHSGLMDVYKRLGRKEDAEKELQWLRRNDEQNPTEEASLNLVQALDASESLTITNRLVEKYPNNPWIWMKFASDNYFTGNSKVALKAIERAIQLTPDSDKRAKGYFYYWKARMIQDQNSSEALRLLVRRFVLDENEPQLRMAVSTGKKVYAKLNFEQILDSLSVPQDKRAALRQAYMETTHPNPTNVSDRLEANLRAIASRCFAKQARPIFVSYPFPSSVERTMRNVAEEEKIPFVNVRVIFDELLKTKRQEELFAPDKHCNDAGYRVIASTIVEAMKKSEL